MKNEGNEIIKTLRGKYNLSREEIATKLHVSCSVVGYWERSERFPKYATIEKLKQILRGYEVAERSNNKTGEK